MPSLWSPWRLPEEVEGQIDWVELTGRSLKFPVYRKLKFLSENESLNSSALAYETGQIDPSWARQRKAMATLFNSSGIYTTNGTAATNYWYYTSSNDTGTTSSPTITWTTVADTTDATYDLGRAPDDWFVQMTYQSPQTQTPTIYYPPPLDQAKLAVVTKKADRLWLATLTDAQRTSWAKAGFVDVVTPRGRCYRIAKGRAGNVTLLDRDGRPVRKYCVYGRDPGGSLPDGDHYFVQLMALRYDEARFLGAANTWDLLAAGHPFVGQGVDRDAPLPTIH